MLGDSDHTSSSQIIDFDLDSDGVNDNNDAQQPEEKTAESIEAEEGDNHEEKRQEKTALQRSKQS